MKSTVLFNAERVDFGRFVELRWLIREHDGTESLPTEVMYTVRTPENMGEVHRIAPLTMGPDSAQNLMDELWRIGFRPSEGSGSAGSLAATERHLKDMQRIAFRLLEGDQVSIKGGFVPEIKVPLS